MLELNGFQAWIEVDGIELQQYDAETLADGMTVTCWVASEVDKRFTIHWNDLRYSFRDTGVKIQIDGAPCGGVHTSRSGKPTSWSYAVTSATTSRPFIFSALELTDDDAYLGAGSPRNLGEITLEIYTVCDIVAASPLLDPIDLGEKKVHERSKKGMGHRVKLGEELAMPNRFVNCQYTAKIGVFTFKYRSLEILKANGIVPTAPNENASRSSTGQKRHADDTPEPDVVKEEDSDAAEIKALQERIKTIEARREGKKRVKLEPIKVEFKPGEVIDLT